MIGLTVAVLLADRLGVARARSQQLFEPQNRHLDRPGTGVCGHARPVYGHGRPRTTTVALRFFQKPHAILDVPASSMPHPASTRIEEGVIDVIKTASRRPVEPTLESELVADLGFDSLQILEVIAELEDRFEISVPLSDVPATRTVAQVVAQVARLVEGRAAG